MAAADYVRLLQSYSPSGLWMLNDAPGSLVAADISGKANHGTPVGDVKFWADGPFPASRSPGDLLDGSTGYVDVPDAPSLRVTTVPFTVGLFVKTNGPIGGAVNILGKTHYTAGLILMYTDATGQHFLLDITPDQYTTYSSYQAGGASIDDGAWHFITGAYDRVNPPTFTVDSAGVTSTDNTSTNLNGAGLNPDSTANLCLGSDATDADSGGSRWPGSQAGAFLIAGTALSVAQRQALYAAAILNPPGGGWWPLQDDF